MKSSPKKRKTREESVKLSVWGKFFLGKGFNVNVLGNIDFTVGTLSNKDLDPKDEDDRESLEFFLWAEAKAGKESLLESFVQLIFTIWKNHIDEDFPPPHYLGAFDEEKIAFVDYEAVMKVKFDRTSFNWNPRPSDHSSTEFKKLLEVYSDTLRNEMEGKVFKFNDKGDVADLEHFIKANFQVGAEGTVGRKVSLRNVTYIFRRWRKKVGKYLLPDWPALEESDGVSDVDFYLADLFSHGNHPGLSVRSSSSPGGIPEYRITQEENQSENQRENNPVGEILRVIPIKDKKAQQAHRDFWSRYKRPPEDEEIILERGGGWLLAQEEREKKGAYFTPPQWVKLSQKYLADVLGENWQDEYYIWDCCAGTGNLLVGLKNTSNVFASTLDVGDVHNMRERIRSGSLGLLDKNVFRFNFLRDKFEDIPNETLREVIADPEKRKKLVIYINPPYAEAASHAAAGRPKPGVAKGDKKGNKKGNKEENKRGNSIAERANEEIGEASNELFVQFLFRIYDELHGAWLGNFGTLKILQGENFERFRNFFRAKLEKMFVVPAYTFANVNGKFPIGFFVWNPTVEEKFEEIQSDVFDGKGGKLPKKKFHAPKKPTINDWLDNFKNDGSTDRVIGLLPFYSPVFEAQGYCCILSEPNERSYKEFTQGNLVPFCIYFAVRLCVPKGWLNNQDSMFSPDPRPTEKSWESDFYFQSDCLVFALFHEKNNIVSKDNIDPHKEDKNYWIPFLEEEVHNKNDRFSTLLYPKGTFMTNFIDGKLPRIQRTDSPSSQFYDGTTPMKFSKEAQAVKDAGRELWKYYHDTYRDSNNYKPCASLYDIRVRFQGTYEDGTMIRVNKKNIPEHETDEYKKYLELRETLLSHIETLRNKIAEKARFYGFFTEE